jgi:competence protein ComEA
VLAAFAFLTVTSAPEGVPDGTDAVGAPVPAEATPETPATDDAPSAVRVDVSGAVRSPAVYGLEAGSRVEDAIGAAGGLTDDADLTTVNRAAVLSDGDRVHIPAAGEDPVPPTVTPSPAPAGTDAADAIIDINAADAEALQALDGIGPVTARAIVDYRDGHGPFTSVEGLMDVPGIGQRTLDRVRGRVRV